MTEELQKKILELRKELRGDYERIGNNYYLVMKEMDDFLERLNNGLEGTKKEETQEVSKY